MTSDQWLRVKELFDAALERDPHERSAFLAATGADSGLQAEVERLLAADDRAAAFIVVARCIVCS